MQKTVNNWDTIQAFLKTFERPEHAQIFDTLIDTSLRIPMDAFISHLKIAREKMKIANTEETASLFYTKGLLAGALLAEISHLPEWQETVKKITREVRPDLVPAQETDEMSVDVKAVV